MVVGDKGTYRRYCLGYKAAWKVTSWSYNSYGNAKFIRRIPKKIFKKMSKVGGLTLSWFQNSPQTYSHGDCVVLAWGRTCRSTEENRQSRNKPHIYSQLIFDTGAKIIQCGKDVSSTNGAGRRDRHVQQNAAGPLPHTIHFNSKWINGLHVRVKAINLSEENLLNLGLHHGS